MLNTYGSGLGRRTALGLSLLPLLFGCGAEPDRQTEPQRNGKRQAALVNPPALPPANVLVLMVHWNAPDSATIQTLSDALFNTATSANAYFREVSFGIQGLTGVVRGWYQIPTRGTCDHRGIQTDALSAATTAGINVDQYDHVVFYFPRTTLCDWASLGELGLPSTPQRYSWLNGISSCIPLLAALTHNYGVVGSRSCSTPPASGVCTDFQDFGNPYCVQGNGCFHLNAVQKCMLGWLGGCNVVTASANGTFDILPLETPSNGLQSLRVPRGGERVYYLEYRSPEGAFDFRRPEGSALNAAFEGVMVNEAAECDPIRPEASRHSYLYDATPGTPSFRDARIAVGQTYTTPDGFGFTVVSNNDTSARVRVTLPGGGSGNPTCMDGSTYGGGGSGGTNGASGASGSGGASGTGGGSGSGGRSGSGGTSGSGTGGASGSGGISGSGGALGSGGSSGLGGASGSGSGGTSGAGGSLGSSGSSGANGASGTTATGGFAGTGSGGSLASGGTAGSVTGSGGGSVGRPGSGGTAPAGPRVEDDDSGGCACRAPASNQDWGSAIFGLLLLVGGARLRRRPRREH